MSTLDIKVPDIGDFDAVAVIELMVKVGDHVKVDQSLITVESDKASMEIPSSHEGVITELKVKVGDKVKEGSVIASIKVEGVAAQAPAVSSAPAPAPAPAAPASSAPVAAPAQASTSSAPSEQAVVVPDIGDFKDVAVIELMVKEGDTVTVDQSLITVESDKASMEIPSSHAGVIKSLKVKVGDKVNKGDLLAMVLSSSGASAQSSSGAPGNTPAAVATSALAVSAAPVAPVAPTSLAHVAAPAHQPSDASVLSKVPHASPSIRKLARELGVPLAEVKGSGNKGRITVEDVHAFSRAVMSGQVQTAAQKASAPSGGASSGAALGLLDWPKVDFTKFGPIERKPMGRIKKISGANLHRNWVMIPHVTNHDDADITDLEAFRVLTNKEHEKSGVKVTMLAFLIKACVAALKKFPEFNSSLDGEELVLKQYYHIGFAADTPNGLMVPVIRDADKKGIMQISQEMSDLAKKAREGKLSPAEMTGACFTISSLGGIGGRYFTPIINAPEVAILGVCKSQIQPVWDGKAFEPRLMLPLSLSWDHRVIDGALAARFNVYLSQILADFRRVLL
jgi:pyruvate dehydrogenase E2 component (dihydrolipoamide acetyltransferase)